MTAVPTFAIFRRHRGRGWDWNRAATWFAVGAALFASTGCHQLDAKDPTRAAAATDAINMPTKKQTTFDATKLAEIDTAIADFIARKQMPGAVFYLQHGGIIVEKAFGGQTYDLSGRAMETHTVFDAASLTKVVATTPAIMLLVEAGQILLDAPLSTYLPEFAGDGRGEISVRHLLTHTSGLPAGLSLRPTWQGAGEALTRACAQRPTHAPGAFFRYSDVNFILLGHLVARVSGMPLERFVQTRIFTPLAMRDSGYLPLLRLPAARIAPTQIIKQEGAERTLQGEVHDPTARAMGGVAGHAGLFTTAADLSRFARMLLGDGALDGVRILAPASVKLMRTVQTPAGLTARRALGFDIDSPFARPRGSVFPIGSFGHTGFTGCILWIDPYSKTFYVFLSNRVYPNEGTNILPLYGQLGTLSALAVRDFDFGNVPGALAPLKSDAAK